LPPTRFEPNVPELGVWLDISAARSPRSRPRVRNSTSRLGGTRRVEKLDDVFGFRWWGPGPS
jgi:hypothetical protein